MTPEQISAMRAQVKAGNVFATSGAEAAYCDAVANACPCCGGSGHKDDAAGHIPTILAQAEQMERMREALEAIQITGPDDDNAYWLCLEAKGQHTMINQGNVSSQIARDLMSGWETLRRAALNPTPGGSDARY